MEKNHKLQAVDSCRENILYCMDTSVVNLIIILKRLWPIGKGHKIGRLISEIERSTGDCSQTQRKKRVT